MSKMTAFVSPIVILDYTELHSNSNLMIYSGNLGSGVSQFFLNTHSETLYGFLHKFVLKERSYVHGIKFSFAIWLYGNTRLVSQQQNQKIH